MALGDRGSMLPKIVFSDFDGTLTKHTALTPRFFDILSLLEENNIPLVVVTGRSISWGHFLLSHFESLNFVIAEGGGIYCRRTKKGPIYTSLIVELRHVSRLEVFEKSFKKKFAKLEMSADSIGRVTDRAIELSDLEANLETYKKVKDFLDKERINFSTSNVHLNFWCGEVDKYKAIQELMVRWFPEVSLEECIFFGDSLNDQSVFRNMAHTIGVANINSVMKHLEYRPSVILNGEENEGPDGVYNYLLDLLK